MADTYGFEFRNASNVVELSSQSFGGVLLEEVVVAAGSGTQSSGYPAFAGRTLLPVLCANEAADSATNSVLTTFSVSTSAGYPVITFARHPTVAQRWWVFAR